MTSRSPAPRARPFSSACGKKGGAQPGSNSALGVYDRLGKRSSEHELKGVAVAEQYSATRAPVKPKITIFSRTSGLPRVEKRAFPGCQFRRTWDTIRPAQGAG